MPISCKLAFGAISISGEGYIKPCCNIDLNSFFKKEYTGGLNSPALTNLRDELIKDIWPKACKECEYVESLGSASMRTIFNEKFKDIEIPYSVNLPSENVIYADIFLSNKCNSKCLTCSPASSDYWLEEFNFINDTNFPTNRIKPFEFEDCKQLIDTHPNIQFISFIGGEPTIINSHLEFLKYLVTTSKSKNISLTYNTNLTGFTSELLNLWSNFKQVGVSISIDGYGKVNEYIRYPFKFSKIDNNLDQVLKLKNVDVGLACTLSVFNAIDIPNLFDYWYDKLSHNLNTDKVPFISTYINRVANPIYMNCNLLSLEYRSRALEQCDNLIKKIESDNLQGSILSTLKLYRNFMLEPVDINQELILQLKNFISKSDTFRKRTIKDYLPELAQELNI